MPLLECCQARPPEMLKATKSSQSNQSNQSNAATAAPCLVLRGVRRCEDAKVRRWMEDAGAGETQPQRVQHALPGLKLL